MWQGHAYANTWIQPPRQCDTEIQGCNLEEVSTVMQDVQVNHKYM